MFLSGLGITMGAHRLWAHRAYKVNTPLKIVLLGLQTLASQVSFTICNLFFGVREKSTYSAHEPCF